MTRAATGCWLVLIPMFLSACQSHRPFQRNQADEQMFGPVSMRIHPTFTQVKDWTGDNHLDGIEAVVELQDQFGDPTRATGKVMFELYSFRDSAPDPKGERIGGPWMASLRTADEQTAHWNSAVRGYSFQLADPKVVTDRSYVLTAQFDLQGGRLFDQIVLEATSEKKKIRRPPHAPLQNPTH